MKSVSIDGSRLISITETPTCNMSRAPGFGYCFRMSELYPSIQIIPYYIEASGKKIARVYTPSLLLSTKNFVVLDVRTRRVAAGCFLNLATTAEQHGYESKRLFLIVMSGIKVFKGACSPEEGERVETAKLLRTEVADAASKERCEDEEFYSKVRHAAINHTQILANAAELQGGTTTQRDSIRKLW